MQETSNHFLIRRLSHLASGRVEHKYKFDL